VELLCSGTAKITQLDSPLRAQQEIFNLCVWGTCVCTCGGGRVGVCCVGVCGMHGVHGVGGDRGKKGRKGEGQGENACIGQ